MLAHGTSRIRDSRYRASLLARATDRGRARGRLCRCNDCKQHWMGQMARLLPEVAGMSRDRPACRVGGARCAIGQQPVGTASAGAEGQQRLLRGGKGDRGPVE